MTAANAEPKLPAASFIDPAALMAIRSLELRARSVVEGFWNGIHRSPWHGFSAEFSEYRQYAVGDDPRHLDWRVFARSDRFFIRKFEDETNVRCHLVVDQSRSMDYGSTGWTKAQWAATLAATLAHFLGQQGDAVGLLSFDEGIRDYLPAKHRPGHLRHLMLALEKPAGGGSTDLVAPLERLVALLRRRGLVLVLSDFLAPLDRLERSLATLTAGGHEVMLFRVLDPAEATFSFTQPILFEDAETGRHVFVDPATARASYLEQAAAHEAALLALCQRLGIALHALRTDEPLELTLATWLRERARRGRVIRRAAR